MTARARVFAEPGQAALRTIVALVKRLGNSQPIEVRVYPDARHAFDVPDLPPLTRLSNGAPIGHDSESAAAREEVQRFLAR
jgi:hypothetical protein